MYKKRSYSNGTLYPNLKAIGEELSEFGGNNQTNIYIFIYIDKRVVWNCILLSRNIHQLEFPEVQNSTAYAFIVGVLAMFTHSL
jgi:hypothetical protein